MEERNILWGELVGGLLVVGCSAALIVSLWHKLADNPLFKFCTFAGANAAITGAGLYTLRRWRLESTSRGLLLVGLLLTPLTLLGLTLPGPNPPQILDTLVQVAAVGALLLLAWRAGRVLTPDGPWLLAGTVAALSACQVPVARQVVPNLPVVPFFLWLLLPVVCFLLGTAGFLAGSWRAGPLDRARGRGLLMFLGVAAFALVVALGHALFLFQDATLALACLALPAALAGLAPLAVGTALHQGLAAERRLAPLRTAGTSIALAGMVVMLLAAGLAWPWPVPLLAVLLLDFAALSVLAFGRGLAGAHALALPCLTAAAMVGSFLLRGVYSVPHEQLPQRMLELAYSSETAGTLLALFALFGLISEVLARGGAKRHAGFYVGGAVFAALAAVALVTHVGLEQPAQALGVYAAAGLGILALNLRWRRIECTWGGLVLLVAASLWGLWWQAGAVTTAWAAVLAAEALALELAGLWHRRRGDAESPLFPAGGDPLGTLAGLVGLAAAGVAGWVGWHAAVTGTFPWDLWDAVAAGLLAALCWVRAVAEGRRWWARLGSWLALAAVLLAAGWYGTRWPGARPELVMALAAGLAGVVLAAACGRGRGVLASAWAETAAGAAVLAIVLAWPAVPERAATLAAAVVIALLLAWWYRNVLLTWGGLLLLLYLAASLPLWGLMPEGTPHPQVAVLLALATILWLTGWLLRGRTAAAEEASASRLEGLYLRPFRQAALIVSVLAVPPQIAGMPSQLEALALFTLWLGGLWLLMAWVNQWPILFGGFQVATGLALVLGLMAWSRAQGRSLSGLEDLLPYGLGLGALALGWDWLRQCTAPNSRLGSLLRPGWPPPDRLLLAALMLGQLALAVATAAPGVWRELLAVEQPDGLASLSRAASSWEAWALLAVLAAAVGSAAWGRVTAAKVYGLLLLALTAPMLAAGLFDGQRAAATTLCWGLAGCFLVCSLPLWLRERLTAWAARRGWTLADTPDLPEQVRLALVACTAVPVLLLTVARAVLGWYGLAGPGPESDTLFVQIGPAWCSIVPLLAVGLGLVIHALRDGLPDYAFVVGLCGNLAATLLVRGHDPHFPWAEDWVPLLQANTIACGAAALLWLATRRRLDGARGWAELIRLQVDLGVLGNAALVVAALVPLLLNPGQLPTYVGQVGAVAGWLALGVAIAAGTWFALVGPPGRLPAIAAGSVLAAGVLAASVAVGQLPASWEPYHVLTAAWGLGAVGLLVAGWRRHEEDSPRWRFGLVGAPLFSTWVIGMGVLVLGLGLRGMLGDPTGAAWPAGAVVFVALLAGALAVRWREEGWAFAAGLLLNLAVSFVLWRERPWIVEELLYVEFSWMRLIQANVLTAAFVTFAWLAAARFLYPSGRPGPLLAVQVGLGWAGIAVLLLGPLALLILAPGGDWYWAREAGGLANWLAVLTPLAATAWYVGPRRLARSVPAQCGLGLILGLLLACTTAAWQRDNWFAYHALMAVWAAVGLLTAEAGWRKQPAPAPGDPGRLTAAWVALVAALLGILALRGALEDPLRPWAPAAGLVAAGVLAGLLALWRRREAWALAAATAGEAAAVLVAAHYNQGQPLSASWISLAQAGAAAAAVAVLAWLAGWQGLLGARRPRPAVAPLLALQVALMAAANVALLIGPLVLLVRQPGELLQAVVDAGRWPGWLALGLAVAAGAWYAARALRQGRVHLLCGLGLALGVLAACTAANADQGGWLSYHVLTAAWAAVAVLALAHGARPARFAVETRLPAGAHLTWVAGVAALVLALALRGAMDDPLLPPWPSCATLLFVSCLATDLALGRRRESWAFVGGLPVVLASALLLWHHRQPWSWERHGLLLAQVVLLTAGLTTLPWLAVRRRLYGSSHPSLIHAPLFGLQVLLLVGGNLALLGRALTALVVQPGHLPLSVSLEGSIAGWAAFLAAAIPAAWYTQRWWARDPAALGCTVGLGLGVLAACTAAAEGSESWLAYHTLLASWSALGLVLLLAGPAASLRAGDAGWQLAVRNRVPVWVAVVGALVLGLSIRALFALGGEPADPGGPWWPAAGIASVSVLCGGLALWRRREAWALAAALGIEAALSLVLWHLHEHEPLASWWVRLVQANVLAGALVSAGWLLACRRLYGSARPRWRQAPLLVFHVLAGLVANAVVLGNAAFRLGLDPERGDGGIAAAGTAWGWLAAAAAGAVAIRPLGLRLRGASPLGSAAGGLAVGVLAACTMAGGHAEGWLAFHVLLAAWTLTGFVVLARGWLWAESPREHRLLAGAVGVLAALVLALAVRAALGPPAELVWSVGAVLAVGAQAAALAVWRRSETWAFVATMCLDLAVSLLVWDVYRGHGIDTWWMQLLQANILSGSAAVLLWLAINRHEYARRPPGVTAAPLLSLQALIGVVGNAVLLLSPAVVELVWHPEDLPASVAEADGWSGWLTLLATAVVAVVQLRVTRMHGGVQVLGSLGLAAGVLAACTAARWDTHDFLAYHVLMAAWVALAACMLVGGFVDVRWRVLARLLERDPRAPVLSAELVREWVTLVGLPVLALAVRGAAAEDPSGPWWSFGAVLAVSALAWAVGVDQRREGWLFAAGLGVNLAASLVLWRQHRDEPPASWWPGLVRANTIAAAAVALLWLRVRRRLYGEEPLSPASAPLLRLQALLSIAGNVALLAGQGWLLIKEPGTSGDVLARAATAASWVALLAAWAAAGEYAWQAEARSRLSWLMVPALLLGVLMACTAARGGAAGDWRPYHVLLATWVLTGLVLAVLGWAVSPRLGAAATGVQNRVVQMAVLVVGLGLRGALVDPQGPWWSAGAVAACAVLCALLAAWRRQEAGAFIGALLLNLAASLVVWRAHLGEPMDRWWAPLAQVNIVVSSAVGLAWLVLGRRLYDVVAAQKDFAPLRGLQCLLGLAGNAAIMAPAAALLFAQPDSPPDVVAQAGQRWGWLALGLAVLPAAGHFGRRLAGGAMHLGAAMLLAVGVLAACSAAGAGQPWQAYHVLLLGWASAGIATLVGGWLLSRPRALSLADTDLANPPVPAAGLSPVVAQAWTAVVGALVVALALRGLIALPAEPLWPAGAILTVSGLSAALAAWRRREVWALLAVAGIHLAVSAVYLAAHPLAPGGAGWEALVRVNLLVGALAALPWLAAPPRLCAGPLLTLDVLLLLAGNTLLLGWAFVLLVIQPAPVLPVARQAGELGGWLAFAGAVTAAIWHFGRPPPGARVPALSVVGLGIAVLTACSTARWGPDGWLAFQALTATVILLAWLALAAAAQGRRRTGETDVPPLHFLDAAWTALLGALALGLSLRGALGDPAGAVWGACGVLAVSAVAAGLAVGRRSEAWAFTAALGVNLAITLLIADNHSGRPWQSWWVVLIQGNVMASSLAALAWLAAWRWLYGDGPARAPLLTVQTFLGHAGNLALLVPPAAMLVWSPSEALPVLQQAGSPLGWAALLLALTATGWHAARTRAPGSFHELCGLGVALAILLACSAAALTGSSWLAYHVLLAAWVVVGCATLLGGAAAIRRPGATASASVVQGWVAVLTALVAGLSLRAIGADPAGPWLSAGGLLAGALFAGALAAWTGRQSFGWVGGLLLVGIFVTFGVAADVHLSPDWVALNMLGQAVAAAVCSLCASVVRRYWPHRLPRGSALPFSHAATLLSLLGVIGLGTLGGASVLADLPVPPPGPLGWAALAGVVLALVVCLWDPEALISLAGLYAAGLAALGFTLTVLPARWPALDGPALAAFVTLVAACVRTRPAWLRLGRALRIPPRQGRWPGAWYGPAQELLAVTAVVLSVWLCLQPAGRWEHLGGPLTVALLLPGALLSGTAPRLQPRVQSTALGLATLLAVELSWVGIDPQPAQPWLERSALLLAACGILALVYTIALPLLLPEASGWPARGRRVGAALAVLALPLLLAVLAQEVLLTLEGVRPLMGRVTLAAAAAGLGALIVAGLCWAIWPRLDPLGWPDRRRTAYVYTCELLLVALAGHLRLAAPQWFTGRLGEHWPLAVLGLAFFGTLASALLARLRLHVLAEPLRRTGVFLPLLPLAAFWVRPAGDYSTVWFLAGLLYALVSVLDRSLGFALLAALAGNAGLWAVLHENQMAFVHHPQLWLVPLALTVLVAAHVNRDRLSRRQLAGLRYAALTTMYLASTAETFLLHLGRDPWQPLVLVGLSLAGVFLGMLLRVRAFLFVGTAFIGLGVFALVWQAAQGQSWLWYVSGIVLGLLLIVLFAVFEKRRADVLHLMERLREWE
jgi:hypothetical protein